VSSKNRNIQFGTGKIYKKKKKKMKQQTIVRLLFIFQGCACLLPFNIFINCPDYFLDLYFPSIMAIISSANLVPNLLGLLFMIFIGNRLHFFITFILPYIFFIVSLIMIPILAIFPLQKTILLCITITLIFSCGCCTSILEGAVFGKSNLFQTHSIIQGVMFGMGIIGVLISILRILTKIFMKNGGDQYVYFFLGATSMLCFMFSFFFTCCIPYTKHVLYPMYTSSEENIPINKPKEDDHLH
jgi:hypothetical protein